MEGSLLEGQHGETLGMVAGALGEQDQLASRIDIIIIIYNT